MKKLFVLLLTLFVLVGCGGEAAVETAVSEPTPSPTAAETPNESEPAGTNDEQNEEGSISKAVIDTSVETAATARISTTQLLSTGRVVVGDADGDEEEAAAAVSLATSIIEVREWLAQNPDWQGVAFRHDGYYAVNFNAADSGEMLGWARVVLADNSVNDYFVTRDLKPDEFAEVSSIVESYVFGEAIIAERFGNLAAWETETTYRRMEGIWEIRFRQGDELLVVPVDNWEERYFIDDIYEVVTLETADSEQQAAIALAQTANGVANSLAQRDDWQIYVAQKEGSVYAVSFVVPERELFYVETDISSDEILVAVPGFR